MFYELFIVIRFLSIKAFRLTVFSKLESAINHESLGTIGYVHNLDPKQALLGFTTDLALPGIASGKFVF